jgi:hypothetical protein
MIAPGIYPTRIGSTVKAVVLTVVDDSAKGLRAVGYFRFGTGAISSADWDATTGRFADDGAPGYNDILIAQDASAEAA